MTPAEFIAKWRKVELRERQFAHEHFIDPPGRRHGPPESVLGELELRGLVTPACDVEDKLPPPLGGERLEDLLAALGSDRSERG
jgi:hypothetical protein